MKKLLLTVLVTLAGVLSGYADSFTVTMKDLLTDNGCDADRNVAFTALPKPLKYSGFEILADRGTLTTGGPQWNTRNGGYFSFAKNCGLTVTAPSGGTISEIVWTCKAAANWGELEASVGSCTANETDLTVTWTGSANSVKFTNNSGKNIYLTEMKVTFTAELPVSAIPVFTPEQGTYPNSVEVSISAAAGASIYYTTDDTNPTTSSTPYTGPFTLERKTTVKAIAVEQGKDPSSVASATYNVMPAVVCNSVRQYIQAVQGLTQSDPGTLYEIKSQCTVILQDGMNLFLQDATGGMYVAGPVGRTYEQGDVITNFSGTFFKPLTATRYDYSLSPVTATFGAPVSHAEVNWLDGTYDNLQSAYDNLRAFKSTNVYYMRNLEAESPEYNGLMYFADGRRESIYNAFSSVEFPAEPGWYDVYCINSITTAPELGEGTRTRFEVFPVKFEAATGQPTATPVISKEAGTYTEPIEVTLTGETGAFIYYSTDGSDATPGSTLYTEPFTLEENCVLNVIAVVAGRPGSEMATAVYSFDILPRAETPVITPESGTTATGTLEVTITGTAGAALYYTLDGTEPTAESTRYTEPFTINRSCTVKAIAIAAGTRASVAAEASFTLRAEAPVFNPEPGTYAEQVAVTLGAGEGISVRYTLDGTEPTVDTPEAPLTFVLNETATVKAIAFAENLEPSEVVEGTFEVTTSGIATIEAADANSAVYYNIQGMRVDNPSRGIFIKVTGRKAEKVTLD